MEFLSVKLHQLVQSKPHKLMAIPHNHNTHNNNPHTPSNITKLKDGANNPSLNRCSISNPNNHTRQLLSKINRCNKPN